MVLITLIHKQCDVIQTLAVSSVKSGGVWFLSKRCFEGIDFSYFVYIVVTHTSLPPIHHGFVPSFVNYKKGCTRLAAASDKVFQLLAHGWWFYRGTPASSTTKIGCHDIAEIVLKVALNNNKSNQIILYCCHYNI